MSNPKSIYNEFIRANLPFGITYDEVRAQYVTFNGKRFPTYLQAKWYVDYIDKLGVGALDSLYNSLFGNDEQGVWYDPSDLDTLFQDTAGTTPVTTAGQTVALMLDKSQGLTLGPELVTNGDFSDGTTGWALGASWAVVDGRASANGTTDGQNLIQEGVFLSEETHLVEFDVVWGVGTGQAIVLRSTTSGQNIGVMTQGLNQRYAFRVKPQTGTSDIVFRAGFESGGDPFSGTIDNISVKELPGNHATQPTAAARPTYGYHPLGGVRNRLTRTEEFDDAVWLKLDTAVTVDAAIDPDGALSADEIIHTGTSADIRQIVTVEDGINHTVSVYVKKGATGSAEWVAFTVRDNSASNGLQAWFNIDTGTAGDLSTFGVGASAVSSSVVDDGNGWYRCAVTGQLPTGITSMRMQFVNVTANGSNTRDQTSSIYIWGAQVEEGSTSTDYQRVGSEYDVTEAGVPSVHYLSFDGVDDFMVTPTITETRAGFQVFAGVTVDTLTGIPGATSYFGIGVSSSDRSQLSIRASGVGGASSVTTELRVGNGTLFTSAVGGAFVVGEQFILTGIHDSTNISISKNGGTPTVVAADVGASEGVLSSVRVGAISFQNRFYTGIWRQGPNLETSTIETTETYVAGKTGVTL